MHILNTGHEYGTINFAMVLPQACKRGKRLNKWENRNIRKMGDF
jgi:hypothetical protein